jgi:hypothetical protein
VEFLFDGGLKQIRVWRFLGHHQNKLYFYFPTTLMSCWMLAKSTSKLILIQSRKFPLAIVVDCVAIVLMTRQLLLLKSEMCRGFLGLQNRAVENWWSVLKTWMKQMLPEFKTVRECVDTAFKNCPNVFA